MQFYIMQLVAMKAASRSLEFSNAAKASRMLAALHLAFINWAQFVALMFVASINSVSLHISDLLRQWRSVQGHPLRGYIFLIMYNYNTTALIPTIDDSLLHPQNTVTCF